MSKKRIVKNSVTVTGNESSTLVARVNERYKNMRSVYVGPIALKPDRLLPGKIDVIVYYETPASQDGEEEFLKVEGSLNKNNAIISGLAKLYSVNALVDGDNEYEITSPSSIRLAKKIKRPGTSSALLASKTAASGETVFEKRHLKYRHIEAFRPENLSNWAPETETDVYMAWGVLEGYTDYKYCCGTSAALLQDLGYCYKDNEQSKPDAILINQDTGAYEIAEMKKVSSAFKSNHNKEDVDVLVVWEDDETDRSVLPRVVITLKDIAKQAALSMLANDE